LAAKVAPTSDRRKSQEIDDQALHALGTADDELDIFVGFFVKFSLAALSQQVSIARNGA
jgi:hypothetical protein